jgi:hypothetical protein
MAKAGYTKTVSSNEHRKAEIMEAFNLGQTITVDGRSTKVQGYWGDRCVVGQDGKIYNVEYDLGYKFKYNQLKP